ncbi:hypothetical protein HanPSC8_Chr14g0640131 [Helianthus annuus]|nr:hypothetical protein HanPSC8_Chr14g0640131 [Helianthus annuus]
MLLSFSFSFPVSSIGTTISPVTVFLHLFTKTLPLNLKESSNIRGMSLWRRWSGSIDDAEPASARVYQRSFSVPSIYFGC